jgi:hypothetical protein
MSLKYVQRKTFTADVNVTLPGGEKGSFAAEYNYLGRKELDELIKQELADTELLEKILVRVSKIVDDNGAELPSEAQFEIVRNDLALSGAVTRTFLERIGGAQKGNSQQSRGR